MKRRWWWVAPAVVLVALAARLEVPVPGSPVPVSAQTLAVVVVGGLLGSAAGAMAMVLYLLAGAVGLPVFAGGAGGLPHLAGPTAGYLAGFVAAAWLAGRFLERGGARRLLPTLFAMLAAHGVILALGVAWLAGFVGVERAGAGGLLPFLPGALLKSAIAAALLHPRLRLRQRAYFNEQEALSSIQSESVVCGDE